jgi:hypothetical protein
MSQANIDAAHSMICSIHSRLITIGLDPPSTRTGLRSTSSPRCLARTRRGTPCQSPAVAGKTRCRMHRSTAGSGATLTGLLHRVQSLVRHPREGPDVSAEGERLGGACAIFQGVSTIIAQPAIPWEDRDNKTSTSVSPRGRNRRAETIGSVFAELKFRRIGTETMIQPIRPLNWPLQQMVISINLTLNTIC